MSAAAVTSPGLRPSISTGCTLREVVPFVFGYVLVANLGIFADAVLPFSLCFVHLLVEHELHRRSSSSAVEFTRALNAGGSS